MSVGKAEIAGGWRSRLRYDPLPPLLAAGNAALDYWARRDLLGEDVPPADDLWQLPGVRRLLARQGPDGSWAYPGGGKAHLRAREDYDQIETYRSLGILVEKYGLTREHPALARAAGWLLAHQSAEGDLRGIYGQQYSPNYTAAIMELLLKAGYEGDQRLEKAFAWLLASRQRDGGWAIPVRTLALNLDEALAAPEALPGDPDKPSSGWVTAVVLRAFAADERRRYSVEAQRAGELLASRFWRRDPYPDRQGREFWGKFSFPFWFGDLLSALDSLSRLGFSGDHPAVANGLAWLAERQVATGLWEVTRLRDGEGDLELWLALAIGRVCRRFWGE